MKISLNWLRRYVDVSWDAEEIARRLTDVGLEVEGLEHIKADFTGVTIGYVEAVMPHPAADRLQLADVRITPDEVQRVVCGASNCRAGITVAYAGLGAVLPGNFKIKKAKIRGEVSLGMLCGEDELGLAEDRGGIMELDAFEPGTPLTEVLPIEDVVFDISITANRGDCLSHLGVARELAAVAGVEVKWPDLSLPETVEGEAIAVEIQDAARCARYVGREINGLGVAPSPLWMRRLLTAVGVRPINNLVDVTNFVLFEYGQPLHAFDVSQVEGRKIVVRTAEAGEKMTTLDDAEHTLTVDDLLICDATRPVALAGVMGGLNSEVKDDTTAVFLESAWFSPRTVRATARRHGLRSESSHRFERAVDPARTLDAANRALHLFAKLSAPGTSPVVVEAFTDNQARAVERGRVAFSTAGCNALLGMEVSVETQREALTRFGFELSAYPEAGAEGVRYDWWVKTPSWRGDVKEAADLIEEVVRYVGYGAVPTPAPRIAPRSGAGGNARDLRVRTARRFLRTHGVDQALNYSFLGRAALARFTDVEPLALLNPMTEDLAVMRTLLAPRLAENVSHNLRHGARDVALFEVGRVFLPTEPNVQPIEIDRLGIALTGRAIRHWSGRREVDFFDLKGLIEGLLGRLGLQLSKVTRSDASWLHPGAQAAVYVGETQVGVFGELHPALARTLDLSAPVFFAELDLAPLVDEAVPLVPFEDFGRHPHASRDMALLVPKSLPVAQVLSSIEDLGLRYVDSVEIFDVYEGGKLQPGARSVGVSVTYRSPDRTLTDDEVNQAHGELVKHVEAAVGAALR